MVRISIGNLLNRLTPPAHAEMFPDLFIWLALATLVIFAALSFWVYVNQTRVVFQPSRSVTVTPEELALPYEDVYIRVASEERIHAWYFPADTGGPTVIFCHGNAGNVSHRLGTAQMLTEIGANVLLFDYRGYGLSDGSPSEDNVYDDAEAAYHWLRTVKSVPSTEIIIFGRSLGGAVGVELAARIRCAGLIIESSFTSATDMGRELYPYLPVGWLVRYHFDSISKIGDLTCPVLVLHSRQDEMIPFRMGEKLHESIRSTKRFVELTGGHNEQQFDSNGLYYNELRAFIHNPGGAS